MRFIQPKHSLAVAKWFSNGILNRKIKDIAWSVGFVKRNDGKLLASTFVKALSFGTLNISNPTLQVVADTCEDLQEGLRLSKVAVYQRLEAGAKLLKEVLKETLEYAAGSSVQACNPALLTQFNNVYVFDSTIISLPEKLAAFYPGSGGRHKAGSLCLQTMFSLVNRCFKNIDVTGSHTSDGLYTKEIAKKLNRGDLAIFDRGYRNKSGHQDIIDRGAYFLTRVTRNSIFYKVDMKYRYPNKELDISEILKKSSGVVDMELLMGANPQRRVKCRFVAIPLPQEVINERIRSTRKRIKGKTLRAKDLEMLRWDTFATNVPADMLPAKAICDMYRLRWQIEIMFKACKSHLGLENVRNCGKHQMECLVYGRLITAVLMSILYSNCYAAVQLSLQREVSVLKFFSYMKNRSHEYRCNMLEYPFTIDKLGQLLEKAALASMYEKRKRKSSLDNLVCHIVPNIDNSG